LAREYLPYVLLRGRALIAIVSLWATGFEMLPFSEDFHHEYWLEKVAA
jgi:hypothetical protein